MGIYHLVISVYQKTIFSLCRDDTKLYVFVVISKNKGGWPR